MQSEPQNKLSIMTAMFVIQRAQTEQENLQEIQQEESPTRPRMPGKFSEPQNLGFHEAPLSFYSLDT